MNIPTNKVPHLKNLLFFVLTINHHRFIVTGEVVNYRVECEDATYVDYSIRDCCIPGDHWQLKGKVWDNYPNTAVTTTPGDPINSPGSVSRVYN